MDPNQRYRMLYDFHNYQNQKKANSVHATYLIYGTKAAQEDADVEMASSMPEHEPLSETVHTSTLTLAREENLSGTCSSLHLSCVLLLTSFQDVLSEYRTVDSIHVYSLAPAPQRDLSALSELSRSLLEYSIKEDSTKAAQKYGIIGNPDVRRRNRNERAKEPAPSAAAIPKPATPAIKTESIAKPTASQATSKIKQEPPAEDPSSTAAKPTASAAKTGTAKPAPALKRGASGGIMQSFAKAASKPQKPKKEPEKEDSSMAMSDDGEADDDDVIPAAKKRPVKDPETLRRIKQEREAELRRMMEEDDDDEEEEEEAEEEKVKSEDEEMEEAPEPEPEPEPEAKKEEEEGPSEVVSATENGRRRGKRRVMLKKRIKDDEGYMGKHQEIAMDILGTHLTRNQLLYKNQDGNHSRKTRRRRLLKRPTQHQPQHHHQELRLRSPPQRVKATSCHFSPKSKHISPSNLDHSISRPYPSTLFIGIYKLLILILSGEFQVAIRVLLYPPQYPPQTLNAFDQVLL